MLDSLYIRNYRSLAELNISKLTNINLIAGKNNTGKTSLLEAIAVFASKGNVWQLLEIIEKRGENYIPENDISTIVSIDANVKTFKSIFRNRKLSFGEDEGIYIGETIASRESVSLLKNYTRISIFFSNYIEEFKRDSSNNIIGSEIFRIKDPKENIIGHSRIGIDFKINETPLLLPLDQGNVEKFSSIFIKDSEKYAYINSRDIIEKNNKNLFEKILVSNSNDYKKNKKLIIDTLNIIENNIEDIFYVGESENSRALVRLANKVEPEPLQSFGDGINRVLSIILAMVNCENGYLLIDEFENGLHYSVQEKLWEVIFSLSERLNIQVFATTHSNDSIDSFGKILNKQKDKATGQLIRLDNKNGEIKVIDFDAEELETVIENDIEIR